MQLVLKGQKEVPADKPPFMGILFDVNEHHEAATINRDLLTPLRNAQFAIEFEPHSKTLDLRLLCTNPISIRFYRNVKYEPEKLEKFMRDTRFTKQFNFSHLVLKGGKETVIRSNPENTLFVLKIDNIRIRIMDRY